MDDLERRLRRALGDGTDEARRARAAAAVHAAARRGRRRARTRRVAAVAAAPVGVAVLAAALLTALPGGRGDDPPPATGRAVVPRVEGLDEDRAWAALRTAGLVPSSDHRPAPAGAVPGTVVATEPPGGSPVPGGATVGLWVAPTSPATTRGAVARSVYVGMLCPAAGRCDRLAVAVFARPGVRPVSVRVAGGPPARLRTPSGAAYREARVVTPAVRRRLAAAGAGPRWSGLPSVHLVVRLVGRGPGGRTVIQTSRVWVAPGYG